MKLNSYNKYPPLLPRTKVRVTVPDVDKGRSNALNQEFARENV